MSGAGAEPPLIYTGWQPMKLRCCPMKQARLLSRSKSPSIFPRNGNAGSDGELVLVVEHVRLLSCLAHLLDRDRIEIGEKDFAGLAYCRINPSLEQHRACAETFRIGGAERHRHAHDLAHADPPPLARQLVAASRPTVAFEDFGMDQALENYLEVTRWQFVT